MVNVMFYTSAVDESVCIVDLAHNIPTTIKQPKCEICK